jgi:hypothetical protein
MEKIITPGLNFFIACDPADRSTRAFRDQISSAMGL